MVRKSPIAFCEEHPHAQKGSYRSPPCHAGTSRFHRSVRTPPAFGPDKRSSQTLSGQFPPHTRQPSSRDHSGNSSRDLRGTPVLRRLSSTRAGTTGGANPIVGNRNSFQKSTAERT